MEKLPKTNRRIKIEFVRLASVASVGFSLLFAANTFGQAPPLGGGPPPSGAPAAAAEATAERVIVTGSNIPTSEETGPNPVDTYRTEDIQKLGVINQTDLLNKLPIEAGGTVNQNIANGGDGAVIPNLRGLLPKETLVLVDGKRVAPNANGAWRGHQPDSIPDDRPHRNSEGWRFGYLWSRRDCGCVQHHLDTQIPRPRDRRHVGKHQHGSFQ